MAKISAYGAHKLATWTKMDGDCKMVLTLTSDGRILGRLTIKGVHTSTSGNKVVAKVPREKLDRAVEIADRYATRRGYTRS